MKKITAILFLLVLMFACKSNNEVKEVKKDDFSEKLKAARVKDGEWKKHVADLESKFNETKLPADGFKVWSRFEAFNPYSGNFDFIKNKITEKYKIEKYEYIKIPTRDGIELDSWFIPVENAKGTIIILHGWSSDMDFAMTQSKFLLGLGYQILVYNARFWNFAANPYDYVGFISNDIEDVGDIIKYISTRKDVDMNKLGIMGFSYGAEKTILAGAKYNELKFVIADAAPIHEDRLSESEYQYVKSLFKPESAPKMELAELDLLSMASKISPKPLLLLHGEKDTSVPLQNSKVIFEKAKEPKVIQTFPNSGHCLGMMGSDKEAYFKAVNDFLEKYVKK